MFYNFASLIVRVLLALVASCSVEGLEHIPRSGPFLLVSNHLNLIDPPVLGAILPRRIVFMAKEELFHVPIVGSIVKWYGAFAVRRGQADRQALRQSIEVLERGCVLGMFPEGHRSKSGSMIEAHPGAALIALLSGATVVPVGITGTDHVRSPFSLLRRPAITIRVGPPFNLERTRSRKEGRDELTGVMMSRVAALLPPERRGFYADATADGERASVAD
jgi:1-acyl-sn-glycerol-3-phosphate acyltransferase